MFGGSRNTLLLFVWVFYIGTGIFGLWDIFSYFVRDGSISWLQIVLVAFDIILLIGGLYFVFNLNNLLPRYSREVIRVFTALFITDILIALAHLPSTLSDAAPSGLEDTFGHNPAAWILGLTSAGIAFNYLIYLIVINSVKKVSGMERKQSAKMTSIYWAIVIAFFASMLLLILWDPNTNSFNVL